MKDLKSDWKSTAMRKRAATHLMCRPRLISGGDTAPPITVSFAWKNARRR